YYDRSSVEFRYDVPGHIRNCPVAIVQAYRLRDGLCEGEGCGAGLGIETKQANWLARQMGAREKYIVTVYDADKAACMKGNPLDQE
ncbi:hypothetical protein HY468_04590, partial [Candidatus Roizmanbacteria bacterium]|nr:hypothetical protein [Candidatus Roizmanbacteria bacterium]